VVAGDHLHGDARVLAGPHRGHRLRAWGVDHADQAEEAQPPGDVVDQQLVSGAIPGPFREAEHPHAGGGHPVHLGMEGRMIDPVGAIPAAVQHHLRGALDDDAPLPVRLLVQGGHELVLGLEGDGVEAPMAAALRLHLHPRLLRRHHQGRLGRVAGDAPMAAAPVQGGVAAQGGVEQQSRTSPGASAGIRLASAESALRRVAHTLDLAGAARGVQTSTTVCSLRVRVPVLSEQMTVVEPRVSTAGSLRMMAWR
jgi:hypothetical protein